MKISQLFDNDITTEKMLLINKLSPNELTRLEEFFNGDTLDIDFLSDIINNNRLGTLFGMPDAVVSKIEKIFNTGKLQDLLNYNFEPGEDENPVTLHLEISEMLVNSGLSNQMLNVYKSMDLFQVNEHGIFKTIEILIANGVTDFHEADETRHIMGNLGLIIKFDVGFEIADSDYIGSDYIGSDGEQDIDNEGIAKNNFVHSLVYGSFDDEDVYLNITEESFLNLQLIINTNKQFLIENSATFVEEIDSFDGDDEMDEIEQMFIEFGEIKSEVETSLSGLMEIAEVVHYIEKFDVDDVNISDEEIDEIKSKFNFKQETLDFIDFDEGDDLVDINTLNVDEIVDIFSKIKKAEVAGLEVDFIRDIFDWVSGYNPNELNFNVEFPNDDEETIIATDEDIKDIVKSEIDRLGLTADLNHIDVSNVTDINLLFYYSEFNGDISNWDVSNVDNMHDTFNASKFNGDISNWNVSNVLNANRMFMNSEFNGDISGWDVSNVAGMRDMFYNSQFDGDISNWDVSNVDDMSNMFKSAQFTGDISDWDISSGCYTGEDGLFGDGTFI